MTTPPTAESEWGQARAAAARAVASLVERAGEIAETGGFEPLVEAFSVEHPAWTAGQVELRVSATPRLTATGTEPSDARVFDVVVMSKSGGSETKRALLRGSTAEIVPALQSLDVPRNVVTLMRELAETQRRFDLP
jgi:hypothetical protein